MLKLPFPEVYIQSVLNADDGKERHVVVDGQQRISSILMFIDNKFGLPIDDHWQGQYFRELDESLKQSFWNYKLVVRGLSETNDEEIKSLFVRLNTNNVSLNDQELRNARFKGRFKQTAERFADNPLFQQIGLFTARDIRRMLDVEFASELLLLTVEGITNKKDLLEDAYARYEADFPDEARFEAEFEASIALLRTILTSRNAVTIKTKSNFYSVYGACLEYYRRTNRTTFRSSELVAERISELLEAARSGQIENTSPHVADYTDAVARAASDKGRRERRQQILLHIIERCETPQAA
jgi:hypothetical protein